MQHDKIPVDVVACDPRHYVRCARLVEAVEEIPPEAKAVIEYHLWTMKDEDGYAMFCALHCHGAPTVAINGHPVFENRVPTIDEFYGELAHAARTEEQRQQVLTAWHKANEEYGWPDQPTAA